MNEYLNEVRKHLRILSETEIDDIIMEIESHIEIKLEKEGKPIEEILNDFGDPKQLALGYIGEAIEDNPKFDLKGLWKMLKFYSLTGLSGMFVVPFLSILSISLYFCAFVVVIAGIVDTVAGIIGYSLPFTVISIGVAVPYYFSLPITIIFAIIFYWISKKLWKYLKKYIATVTNQHRLLKR